MKKSTYLIASLLTLSSLLFSCGGSESEPETSTDTPQSMLEEPAVYDAERGEGKWDATNLTLGALDDEMATRGEAIFTAKCSACHKLTDEKLVGPGWKGQTEKRKAHWILNFILNPDPMLDKDPSLKAEIEVYKTRMVNQNLTEAEAREVLEFMRKNDGVE